MIRYDTELHKCIPKPIDIENVSKCGELLTKRLKRRDMLSDSLATKSEFIRFELHPWTHLHDREESMHLQEIQGPLEPEVK